MQKLTNIWKNRIVTSLGFLVIVSSMSYFPRAWTDKIDFVFGLAIVILSFQLGKFLVYGEKVDEQPESNEAHKN